MTRAPASPAPASAPVPLVLLLALVWGTNWPLFALAVSEVSVWTFRAVSTASAGALLLAWSRWRGEDLRIPRRHWPTVAAAACLYLGIWNAASTYAAILIPSGQAAVLGFTMPAWATLGAWLFLGQRLRRMAWCGVALSCAGVGLLMAKGWQGYTAAPAGFLLGLLAGIGWAAGTLVLKRRPLPIAGTVLAGWQLLGIGVPFALVAVLRGSGDWFVPSATSIAVIAYITVIPMALGNVAWFTLVTRLPAHVAALSPVLVPVVAMLAGAWVNGEPLGLYEWLAMGCCVAGLVLNLRPAEAAGEPVRNFVCEA